MRFPFKSNAFLFTVLALLLNCRIGSGQTIWNIFPDSGNVGIGTLTPSAALQLYGDGKRLSIRSQTVNAQGRPGIVFGRNSKPFFAGDGDGISTDQLFHFYSVWSGTRTYNAEVRIHGNTATANWDKYLALKHDGVDGRISTDVGSLILSPASSRVGIGTNTPISKLDIYGNGSRLTIRSKDVDELGRPGLVFGKNSLAYIAGDSTSGNQTFAFYSVYTGNRTTDAQIRVFGRSSNWSKYLELTHDGSNGLVKTDAGHIILSPVTNKVGIGTNSPQSMLSVNGTITAKDVVVTNTGWADFVFADEYPLKPLPEVEQYLKANKRLPEIPSAQEVAKHGVNVGEMQSKLLQKIEELTLYVIELKKENERLHQRVNSLERQQ